MSFWTTDRVMRMTTTIAEKHYNNAIEPFNQERHHFVTEWFFLCYHGAPSGLKLILLQFIQMINLKV